MSYTYEQVTGKLRDDDGNIIGIGYSGAGEHKNNPTSEHIVDQGPIVHGTYTIFGPPRDTPDHGPYVLTLVPDEVTRLLILSYGRDPGSFLMHGDSIKHPGGASEGCIILDRLTREGIWGKNAIDNTLEVISGINPDIDGEISV